MSQKAILQTAVGEEFAGSPEVIRKVCRTLRCNSAKFGLIAFVWEHRTLNSRTL